MGRDDLGQTMHVAKRIAFFLGQDAPRLYCDLDHRFANRETGGKRDVNNPDEMKDCHRVTSP